MLPPPHGARVYRAQRRIRLSDVGPSGRLRLDAAARYMQDVATDDVADAGIDDGRYVWIVRRTAMDVLTPFSGDGAVDVATWSGGFGPRWAARRTRIDGDRGGRIDAVTTWVLVDAHTMRPALVPAEYRRVYGNGPPDGRVPVKLTLPVHVPANASRVPWPLRVSDVDVLGHVNNAVYWQAVEQALASAEGDFHGRALLEHRRPVDLGNDVELRFTTAAEGVRVWLVAADVVAAVAELIPAAGSLGIAGERVSDPRD